jgi:hypothetical protein
LRERVRRAVRIAITASVLVSEVAVGGAPFQTDDPGVVLPGRFELVAFHQSTLAGDTRTGTLLGLELHAGVIERLEVDVTAPLAFVRTSRSGNERG